MARAARKVQMAAPPRKQPTPNMALTSLRRPKFQLPDGYTDEMQFLGEFREDFADDDSADNDNHQAGVQDLSFLVGDQWDDAVKAQRIAALKPVLTLNRLPAFVAQIIGRRKQNETQIRIVPDNGGTKPIAKVREGLVRQIQRESRAEFAYENALVGCVASGIGNFQLDLQYVSDDVWEQKIQISPILDHFAVVWDRMRTDPTGKDARRCNVVDTMSWKEFMANWPWATPADIAESIFRGEQSQVTWFSKTDVKVVTNWRMRSERRVIALLVDGTTVDITDEDTDDPRLLARVAQRGDGSPYIREIQKPYAEKYVCSALNILEGPYRLPIDRVPVFRVPAWEIRIGEVTHRWGLIRHMKDPQRLHNLWRSVIAEKIMRSPKATWMAAASAVAGREASWRNSAKTDDPLLVWNDDSGHKPERMEPIQVEGALIQESAVTSQDLKDISNIHEANLGMPSNEVSGRAINARVQVSDVGTALYTDSLENAIEEAGRITNELIPIVYDTPRIVKIVQEDGEEMMQAINQVADAENTDVTQGKYSVTAITGRSYATKREEEADGILALAQAMPETFSVAPDLLVEAMDWPDADKIAKRFRKSLPPNLLEPDELTPEQQAGMQQQSQAAQTADQIAQADATTKIQKGRADTVLALARAANYGAQARATPQKVQLDAISTASEAQHREVSNSLAAAKIAVGGK